MPVSADKAIGIFGGTFNPVHVGHINAVDQLTKVAHFDTVHWVLSARPPHKNKPGVSIDDRFQMLKIALEDKAKYIADDTEINKADASYTLHTLQHFRAHYPNASLSLIIGADSLQQITTWHRYQELGDFANIVVLNRPGYSPEIPEYLRDSVIDAVTDIGQHKAGKLAFFDKTEYAVSSTFIRRNLTKSDFDADLLPAGVYDYIQQHNLYDVMNAEQIKDQVVAALEDVKGQDIKVIDIEAVSDFADYMVIVSGTSDTHVRALGREASDQLRSNGVKPLNEDGADLGEWILVDFGDVVLHVMRPEVREYYDLEKLWDEDIRNVLKQHRETQTES